MDHASAGRRKLEEIRLKKAAERAKLIQSGSEQDLTSLKIENERDSLRKQLDESLQQIQTLTRELKDAQNQASKVADLNRSVKSLSVERDAAIMAKEDLLAQLRLTRRRLQEAEDEQYKAEEDAAVLRAELKHLQHSASSQSLQSQYTEQYGVSDQELNAVKAELQGTRYQLQQEHQLLVLEQQKVTKVTAEKNELEQKIAQLTAEKKEIEQVLSSSRNTEKDSKQATVNPAATPNETADSKWKSKVERGKYEQHVRELASMVQRLENGRQKLLAEIDMQSLEIEKLFMENAGLVNGLNETSEIAARWERQLRDTVKQNAELHRTVEELSSCAAGADDETSSAKQKMDLTGALGDRDQLIAQISQLSLELDSARHKLNGFHRLYGPVLSSLETKLLQIKHDPEHTF